MSGPDPLLGSCNSHHSFLHHNPVSRLALLSRASGPKLGPVTASQLWADGLSRGPAVEALG